MKLELTAKTALITGGSSGIAESCVRLFRESGADVYFTYNKSARNAANIEEETSSKAVKCDVASEKQGSRAVQEVISASQKLDILVNNAGIYLDAPPVRRSFCLCGTR